MLFQFSCSSGSIIGVNVRHNNTHASFQILFILYYVDPLFFSVTQLISIGSCAWRENEGLVGLLWVMFVPWDNFVVFLLFLLIAF